MICLGQSFPERWPELICFGRDGERAANKRTCGDRRKCYLFSKWAW
jgi:hypothetical protein